MNGFFVWRSTSRITYAIKHLAWFNLCPPLEACDNLSCHDFKLIWRLLAILLVWVLGNGLRAFFRILIMGSVCRTKKDVKNHESYRSKPTFMPLSFWRLLGKDATLGRYDDSALKVFVQLSSLSAFSKKEHQFWQEKSVFPFI